MAEPKTPEEQQAEERRRRAAAAAVAGGTLVVIGGEDDGGRNAVPPAAKRLAATGTILSGLVAYLATQRARMDGWLREQMRRRSPAASPDDIERVIADEARRQEAFEKKQAERYARDITAALAIPDAAQREGAIRGINRREQQYARQRDEAMAARAFAAIDRVVLRTQSPTGAFWKLDPTVIEHTAGCLIMGGKFWPWQVLDRVHPPRHAGCPCRLIGYGEAVADGLLSPGQVVDVQTAVRRAAAVVMEGALVLDVDDAEALIEDAGGRDLMDMRCTLIEADLVRDESVLDRLLTEQWRDIGGPAGGQFVRAPGLTGRPKAPKPAPEPEESAAPEGGDEPPADET